MNINNKMEVFADATGVNFITAKERLHLSPMELVPLLYVFRGMSEREGGNGFTISHLYDPRCGYEMNINNNITFFDMKEAFILMLALERVIGKFI